METEELIIAIQNAANTLSKPNLADIASVFLSFIAVVVACIVAWKQNEISRKQAEISDAQNKISLFEKRFEVYETARQCIRFAHDVSKYADNLDDVYESFYAKFCKRESLNIADIKNRNIKLFIDVSDILLQSQFLFSTEISQKISAMSAYLLILASTKYFEEEREMYKRYKMFEEARCQFCQCARDIDSSNILDAMKNELNLQSIKI